MQSPLCFLLLLLFVTSVFANVEKVIFVAPKQQPRIVQPALDALNSPYLECLSPDRPVLRRHLHAHFSQTPATHEESEAWIRLEGLQAGRRYEVRVCWSATQPTAFELSVYEPAQLPAEPTSIDSLQEYIKNRKRRSVAPTHSSDTRTNQLDTPSLFHISAKADYFTSNNQLMTEGLLVEVDIILDPFLLNVFPRSLLPTAGYLVIIAIGAWFLSGVIADFLAKVASSPAPADIAPKKRN